MTSRAMHQRRKLEIDIYRSVRRSPEGNPKGDKGDEKTAV